MTIGPLGVAGITLLIGAATAAGGLILGALAASIIWAVRHRR
jgi:hypothetical protein